MRPQANRPLLIFRTCYAPRALLCSGRVLAARTEAATMSLLGRDLQLTDRHRSGIFRRIRLQLSQAKERDARCAPW
jgi:hypothetical protein